MKRVLASILTVILSLLPLSVPMTGNAADEIKPTFEHFNYFKQNYDEGGKFFIDTEKSYFIADDNGFLRVEHIKNTNKTVIERYDINYNLTSQQYIADELSFFSGFYYGENYCYFVYGDYNTEKDDEKEVYRIVRYSKDFERLDSGKVLGLSQFKTADAKSIAGAGNYCAFAEKDNLLFIRSNVGMYNGHQSNITIVLDNNDMSTRLIGRGSYVSHSMAQYVEKNNQGDIVFIDHGDGYPRALAMIKYDTEADELGHRMTFFQIYGEEGDNCTGVTLDAVSSNNDNYFVSFTSVDQDEETFNNGKGFFFTENSVYLSTISNDEWMYNTQRVYECNDCLAENTSILKFDDNAYMLIWQIKPLDYYWIGHIQSSSPKVCYVMFDGDGNITSNVETIEAKLSDCKPMVYGDEAYWYVTSIDGIHFCSISRNGDYREESILEKSGLSIGNADVACWNGAYQGKQVTYYFNTTDLPLEAQIEYQELLETQSPSEEPPIMITGWYHINNKWMYYDDTGVAYTGWHYINRVWYFFNSDGIMQTGWVKVGSVWYYMNNSGAMQTGWQKVNGTWYYLKSNGEMARGWLQLSGKWYYMDSSGAMRTGWLRTGGKWYYLWSSGSMAKGWIKTGGKWYYLENDGKMRVSNLSYKGKIYRFNSSGACINP